ncbi:Ig-like domain-containing protein [Akkermansiaceae bacterium]|nr:Ig-like domain-containing protein [Akkermansiaceae bacterium]
MNRIYAPLAIAIYSAVLLCCGNCLQAQSAGNSILIFKLEETITNRVARTGTYNSSAGLSNVVLAPNTVYRLSCVSTTTLKYGIRTFETPDNGQRFVIPQIKCYLTGTGDPDGDGLPTEAEAIIGTDPAKADTDGDGISDGAEVRQGTNPLDGIVAAAGVIASAPTTGSALHVSASNNIAAVAMGTSGISIFNVFSGMSPSRILDVDTPGSAVAVASAGDFVCVADQQAGLAIIDVGDPQSIRLTRQIPLGAVVTAVASDGVAAYVGTGAGELVGIDLATGVVTSRLKTGGSTPEDIQIAGETLYLLDSTSLRIYRLTNGGTVASGTVALSGLLRGGLNLPFRLFCDGKTAYCTHSRGYYIMDVANPATPQLVSQYVDGQLGWKQIVANGSGLAIAATEPNLNQAGAHDISLYDVGTDGRSTVFRATLETPGLARSLSIYNGLAYVADSERGLQVFNYLDFDTKRIAPTIALSSNFNLAGGMAEEGKRMRLSASVTDDVQVRNVEFYVNGALRSTDGNYPFEFAFLTPSISSSGGIFTIRAKATDTGGNSTWTNLINLTLTRDATPPVVVASSPVSGSLVGAINEAWVRFNEPMAADTLSSGLTVTLGGTPVLAKASYRESTNTAFLSFVQPLNPGNYILNVTGNITDAAGNGLASPLNASFRVFALTDDDADGLADDWESLLGLDKTKTDTNGNGILDGDEDFDVDGVSNGLEVLLGTDPTKTDSNGNGIPDGLEDSDLDGLTDAREFVLGTDRFKADTDDDTWSDEAEVSAGSNPLDPRSRPYPFLIQSPQITALHIGQPGNGMLTTVRSNPEITALNFGAKANGDLGSFFRSTPFVNTLRFNYDTPEVPGSILLAKPPVKVQRDN